MLKITNFNSVYGDLLNNVNRFAKHTKKELVTETKVYTIHGERLPSRFHTHLEIQEENIRASESKVSDVDEASSLF